ncbi:MAG TPA: hypothetical protein VHM22_08740 [Bradyrhizobium sp.]|jgi:hypothetical protein|nr:hypothetical protein [Bradyrhizobium sp.]
MPGQHAEFDYGRYRRLLAEAVDDRKRLAFINLLIEERARERLEAQRASDRVAMTLATITTVLSSSPG